MKRFHRTAVLFAAVFSLFVLSCQHTTEWPEEPPRQVEEMEDLSGRYQEELREILLLARSGDWEEASVQAEGLYAMDPDDLRVRRVHDWIQVERKRREERAIEAELADIAAQDSRFSPTLHSTFLETRKRGLPISTEMREDLSRLEQQEVIPDSFGNVVREKGPLVGIDEVPRGRMARVLDKEVTIQLDDVSLESIIFNLGEAQGINFIADRSIPAFQEKLSVNMREVRLREFLRYVTRNLGVHFQVGEDLIWVVDGSDEDNLMRETRFYRLRKGFVMPAEFGAHEVEKVTTRRDNVVTETETQEVEQFVRDGAPPFPSLDMAIQKFFTGEYMIDYERNLVVATGTPDELEVLDNIIAEFDKPVKQVLIEARFITVSQAAFTQLGVSWETGRPDLVRDDPMDFTGFGTNVGLGLQETFRGVFGKESLSATLTALEQSGESKTLSSPRITVVNNRPATISDGKVQYYYEEYSVSQTITEQRSESQLVPKGRPTKLTSGVSLDVLASIGGDGEAIMLALRPKVSQEVDLVTFAEVRDVDAEGRQFTSFEIRLPESRDQELSTRVVVRSGETVVMGGVVERAQSTFVEAVPILGNIPIIGAAFRKRTEFDQPRYLLIFVTATLLSDTGAFVDYTDNN